MVKPVPGKSVTNTTTFANVVASPSYANVFTAPVPSPTCFKVGSAHQRSLRFGFELVRHEVAARSPVHRRERRPWTVLLQVLFQS
jgi:hypothetical protein